jgi:hypothetical protein
VWVSLPIYVLAALLFLAAAVLYLIPVVVGFTMDPYTSRFLGAILKGARTGEKYLSYVPYTSLAPFLFVLPVLSILLPRAQRYFIVIYD